MLALAPQLRQQPLGQFRRRLLQGRLGRGLLGDVHRHTGLAVHGDNLAVALLGLDLDAGLAGDQVALCACRER